MLIKKCVKQFSFLFLLGFGTLSAQQRMTDFRLIGSLESVQSVTYLYGNPSQTAVSGFLDHEEFDSVFLKFDRKGNLILRENYLDYRGKLGLFNRTIYQINPSNQLEKSETTLVQNGEEPRKISQRKIHYYLKNQLIRTDEFNSGRTSNQFWVMNATYKNGEIAEKTFWMEDEIFSIDKFSYNWQGLLETEQNYHNNGTKGKSISYEYSNRQLLKKTIRSGNEITIETFNYDKAQLAQHSFSENGKIIWTKTYDENGLLSELKKFNHITQQTDTYSFEFELDSSNNWTKCEVLKNQNPIYVTKRNLNYFNN